MGRVMLQFWPFNRWRAWRDAWRFCWPSPRGCDAFPWSPHDYTCDLLWFNGAYFYGGEVHSVMSLTFSEFWAGIPIRIGPPRIVPLRDARDIVGPWGDALENQVLRSELL